MHPRETPRALWLQRNDLTTGREHAPCTADLDVDVAIIGGGIVGATAALLIGQSDLSGVLLEAQDIGGGTTGNSTAKASLFHGNEFQSLLERLRTDDARRVLDGDRAGLDLIAHWAERLPEAGDAHSVWHWAYATDDEGHATLEREAAAAATLGIETAWADGDALPVGRSALGVRDQLLIEPARLCRAFAARAAADGVAVHERTRVTEVDPGDVTTLRTSTGATIRARHVIVATQVPILDRSLVFAACSYTGSHALAFPMDDAFERFPDMYTGFGNGGLSLRPARADDGSSLIVVAGNGHELSSEEDGTHVERLAADARALLGLDDSVEPVTAWLAHDAFPSDGRPFVGPMHGYDAIHVATGFGGWGLARGVAAAMTIVSLIRRGHAEWADPMDARRLGAFTKPSVVKEGLVTATGLVKDRLTARSAPDWDDLERGAGTVVRDGVHVVAVARDDAGELHAVSAACTHMGCVVQHDAERGNWQCPCHGSRFAVDGTVLNGPAIEPLERRPVPGVAN